jgi:perosamine synthetase
MATRRQAAGGGGGGMNPTMSMNIPIARPSFGRLEEEAVIEVLRSGWVSQGPRVAEFERKFAEYVGAAHAVAVSSCTTALHLALVAAGVKPGDEVICPSLSFIATANAIVYAGATPVFVDIDRSTYNLDPSRIEESISARTRAILLVHQIGLPAAIDDMKAIASRHGLAVVEDAACAIGSEYQGQRIGKPHTSMACFSFHPRKVLTTAEGGMLTTNDSELAARVRRLRQHAMNISDLARHRSSRVVIESYDEIGYNYRMTDLQAAIGQVQLHRLDKMLARRRELAERYSERLSTFGWLVPPQEPSGTLHNFQSYMVRLTDDAPLTRDALTQELLDRGVASRRGIMAIHRELPYHDEAADARLPNTNLVTDTSVILPLFCEMKDEEQEYVMHCFEQVHTLATRAA